jgi:DME family drug/metabolite transporter
MYGVSVRYAMGGLHPLIAFGVISAYTSVFLLLMAPLGEPSALVRLPVFAWLILVVSSLLGVAIAHGLYYFSVQRIGVAITSLTLAATPFVSALVSRIVFEERFTPVQWAGGLVLLGGSSLALWSQQHLPRGPSAETLAEVAPEP